MTPEERIQARDKAQQAKTLLESDILGEAFTAIEKKAIEEMLRLDHDDDKGRKHCVDRVNAIRALAGELQSLVAGGMSADRDPPTLGPR